MDTAVNGKTLHLIFSVGFRILLDYKYLTLPVSDPLLDGWRLDRDIAPAAVILTGNTVSVELVRYLSMCVKYRKNLTAHLSHEA